MHCPITSSGTPVPAPRRRLPRRVAALIVPAALLALIALPPVAQAAGRDSDGDDLSDHYERTVSHTNPHRADTDNDGLPDRYEIRRSKTNPLKSDTDGDGSPTATSGGARRRTRASATPTATGSPTARSCFRSAT